MKKVIVAFIGQNLAEQTCQSFVHAGTNSLRRPRSFEESNNGWLGQISFGEDHQYSVPVEVISAANSKEAPKADWYVIGGSGRKRHHFVLSQKSLASIGHCFDLPAGRILLLIEEGKTDSKYLKRVADNAASQLAAEITAGSAFRPAFLDFPRGEESRHFQMVHEWVKSDTPIKLVSGCCLNADASRRGIVGSLSTDITALLARTVQAAFDQLPIHDWYIYTFGPKDHEWLGDLGIQKVLLPYMWNAPTTDVRDDLHKNYELTKNLGEIIQAKVNFPVVVGQLSDYTSQVDIAWLIEASRERAKEMLPKLMARPPAIFSQLQSPRDVLDRVQQEAFLYLLYTTRWGQLENTDRAAVLYAGLEVHGGYWANGNLFSGPRGDFLPLAWFPQCVRQHWGHWTLANRSLAAQRQRLSSQLAFFGY